MPAKTSSFDPRQTHGPRLSCSQVGSKFTSKIKISTSKKRSEKQAKKNSTITTTNSPLEMTIILPNKSTDSEKSTTIDELRQEIQELRKKSSSITEPCGLNRGMKYSSSQCSGIGHTNIVMDPSEIEVVSTLGCFESESSLNYSVSQCPSESFASLCASSLFDSSFDINGANKEAVVDDKEEDHAT